MKDINTNWEREIEDVSYKSHIKVVTALKIISFRNRFYQIVKTS